MPKPSSSSRGGDPGPHGGYPGNQSGMMREAPPVVPPLPQETEELPPLPPPPQDLYGGQLQEEQQKLMESLSGQGGEMGHPPGGQSYDRYGQPLPANSYNRAGVEGQRGGGGDVSLGRLPPSSSVGYPGVGAGLPQESQAPNYQNIHFVSEVRADAGPAGQVPSPPSSSQDHNVYEPFSRTATTAAATATAPPQLQQQKQQPPAQPTFTKPSSLYLPHQKLLPPSTTTTTIQPQPSPITPSGLNKNSAWDREEKEKAEEKQAEALFKARAAEIGELESRSYLSVQEQDRLRKLKLEHEFQRRVREVDEKGDYDVGDDDEDIMERLFTRERLIQSLKDDLDKSQQRIADLDKQQQQEDSRREKERLHRLERRLEMMEKDRQEMHERMDKRQQRRTRDHQEQLRQQREAREKQRQNYDEQKRLLVVEEEKMRQRREEEMTKRRQMEQERRQEMQLVRDSEEQRLRAEVRRQNDNYVTQQMLQQRQQRQDQNRDIRVAEERQRLEQLSLSSRGQQQPPQQPPGGGGGLSKNGVMDGKSNGMADQGYQQYMNLPPPPPPQPSSSSLSQQQTEKENQAPPPPPAPPQRNSSYNSATITRNHLDYTSLPFHPQQHSSLYKQQQQPPPPVSPQQQATGPGAAKKSVSFNTDMNTYKDRTPSHSFSSDHNISPSTAVMPTPAAEVFDLAASSSSSSSSPPHHQQQQQQPPRPSPPSSYGQQSSNSNNNNSSSNSNILVSGSSTPKVIGAQEVYRDPRNRIEAQKAAQAQAQAQAQGQPGLSLRPDRMSFKDKMKYFAQEAGEGAPKYKPKASKTLRIIESQLNGQ